MYSVAKTFHVPIGHRLSKHKGACKNFHGHNLKITVVISSVKLDSNDMVIDFSVLKKLVNNAALKSWDHCCILNMNDKKNDEYMRKNGYNVFTIECDPTSEALCRILYEELDGELKRNKKIRRTLYVEKVRIWESDDSWAEYVPDWQMSFNGLPLPKVDHLEMDYYP